MRHEIVHASAAASAVAVGYDAEKALDQNLQSGWCTDNGGMLTIELGRPVAADRVVVTPGLQDKRTEEMIDRSPSMEVALDLKGFAPAVGETPDADTIVVPVVDGRVSRITVKLPENGMRGCIASLTVEQAGKPHSLLFLQDEGRIAELMATIDRLRKALSTCDGPGLYELSTFPLTYIYVGREGTGRATSRHNKRTISTVGELLAMCRPAPFRETLVREVDASTVAVEANGDFTLRYKPIGGWKLVELPDDYPSRH